MNDFNQLKHWNPDRDRQRRSLATQILSYNNIEFTVPSKGQFKIKTSNCYTLMFYPKSGKLIWKETKKSKQKQFVNSDTDQIIQKIKSLIERN